MEQLNCGEMDFCHQGVPASTKDSKPSLLARWAGANHSFSMEVAEVLLYNRELRDSERRDLKIISSVDVHWTGGLPLLVRLSSSMHPDFSSIVL